MTKPKNTSIQDPEAEETQELSGEQDDLGDGRTTGGDTAETEEEEPVKATSAPARKPLGTKEVVPFKWKLIGDAHDATLTLFKSTDRQEIDAHLERVQKEGYYKNLRVVDIDTKIKQPKPPPPPKKVEKPAKKPPKAARKVTKKAAKAPAKPAEKAEKKAKATEKAEKKARAAEKAEKKTRAAEPAAKNAKAAEPAAPSPKKPSAKKARAKSAKKAKKKSAPARSSTKRSGTKKKKA